MAVVNDDFFDIAQTVFDRTEFGAKLRIFLAEQLYAFGRFLIGHAGQVMFIIGFFLEQSLESIKHGHEKTFQQKTKCVSPASADGFQPSGSDGQEFGFGRKCLKINFLPGQSLMINQTAGEIRG